MSGRGTKRTSRHVRSLSAFGGKADISQPSASSRDVANAGPASAICVQPPQCSGPKLGDEPRDRLAILVGRILLQKVKAFDRYGLLVRLGAAEVPRAADEKASRVAVDEEFRDRAGREPLALWRTNRFG